MLFFALLAAVVNGNTTPMPFDDATTAVDGTTAESGTEESETAAGVYADAVVMEDETDVEEEEKTVLELQADSGAPNIKVTFGFIIAAIYFSKIVIA